MGLRVVPCDLATANEFVRRLHRHARPVVGHRFSVGVAGYDGVLRGVAIVGRPVARRLDDGRAAEITRVCTDGTRNACSMLYAACRKAATALGYSPIYTYTLAEESGASLRAAGFKLDKETAGGASAMWHSRPERKAQPVGDDLVGGKLRWIAGNCEAEKPVSAYKMANRRAARETKLLYELALWGEGGGNG